MRLRTLPQSAGLLSGSNIPTRAAAEARRANCGPPSTAIRGCETMTDLLLQPSPARGPNDYEVIADDWIVGRIVLSDASPAEKPWMWSLDHEFYQGREGGTATKPRGRPPCRRSPVLVPALTGNVSYRS